MSDPDRDDILAAEFVLGTLDAEERLEVERRLEVDGGLKQAVTAWEERLEPLLGLYADVTPPSGLIESLMARLASPASAASLAPRSADVVVLRRSLQRWRAATVGALALAASLIAWIAVAPDSGRGGRFVAVLQKDAGSPAIVLDVDVGTRRASIRQVSAEQPSDRSYELWLINPELGTPRSLGVVRARGVTDASLASFDAAAIARATYAITVEPPGGSPNGVPSGPPVLSGKLIKEEP